jgi:hypothetical protein
MSLDKLTAVVESREFAADLGVVSTPRAFDEVMLKLKPVKAILKALAGGANASRIAERVTALLATQNPAKYRHPFDLPIGVYLRVLEIAAPHLAYPLALRVLAHRNFWWARAIAARIAAAHPNRAGTSSIQIAPLAGAPVVRATLNAAAYPSPLVATTPPPLRGMLDADIHTIANDEVFELPVGPGIKVRTATRGGGP